MSINIGFGGRRGFMGPPRHLWGPRPMGMSGLGWRWHNWGYGQRIGVILAPIILITIIIIVLVALARKPAQAADKFASANGHMGTCAWPPGKGPAAADSGCVQKGVPVGRTSACYTQGGVVVTGDDTTGTCTWKQGGKTQTATCVTGAACAMLSAASRTSQFTPTGAACACPSG